MRYEDFLDLKLPDVHAAGKVPGDVHGMLFPFQKDIVKWAVRRGRAAVFADCGLGKTLIQLEWARLIGGRCLIVAPLAVAEQTINEGARIGLTVRRVARPDDEPGISITNYEKLPHFVGVKYDAIVLDESSILKSEDGKTRTMILREFSHIPYRLACTATPAPNDIAELANHAEFVGAMSRVEMLATFFVHDEDGWRLKGHAADAMWRWMAKWAVYVRTPDDLGYDSTGFSLPPLHVIDEVMPSNWRPDGQLFGTVVGGVGGRQAARRASMGGRVERSAEIIEQHDGQWIVWCGLNDEGRQLKARLGDQAALIEGQDSDEDKIAAEHAWRSGEVRVLITKPKMFGFGLNWQHCHQVLFLGIGDSYEQYYQAIRRCWRFGQKSPVDVRIVVSDAEGTVAANVKRKEREAADTAAGVVEAMREVQTAEVHGVQDKRQEYATAEDHGDGWRLMMGTASSASGRSTRQASGCRSSLPRSQASTPTARASATSATARTTTSSSVTSAT